MSDVSSYCISNSERIESLFLLLQSRKLPRLVTISFRQRILSYLPACAFYCTSDPYVLLSSFGACCDACAQLRALPSQGKNNMDSKNHTVRVSWQDCSASGSTSGKSCYSVARRVLARCELPLRSLRVYPCAFSFRTNIVKITVLGRNMHIPAWVANLGLQLVY